MSTTITYKNNQLTSFKSGTKTLKTAGKYLEDDIAVSDNTVLENLVITPTNAIQTFFTDEKITIFSQDNYTVTWGSKSGSNDYRVLKQNLSLKENTLYHIYFELVFDNNKTIIFDKNTFIDMYWAIPNTPNNSIFCLYIKNNIIYLLKNASSSLSLTINSFIIEEYNNMQKKENFEAGDIIYINFYGIASSSGNVGTYHSYLSSPAHFLSTFFIRNSEETQIEYLTCESYETNRIYKIKITITNNTISYNDIYIQDNIEYEVNPSNYDNYYKNFNYTTQINLPDGYNQIAVNAIPSEYIIPTGTKTITSNGTGIDVSSYATVDVNVAEGGSSISLQTKTVSPTESQQTVSADSNYDGLSSVTVNAISSTYVGSGVTKKAAATYTPTTTAQTISAGQYLQGAQTIAGDSNLISNNIASGVSIFGVQGSLSFVNYYTGSSAPSNSLGSNGDIYLQTTN